MVSFRNSAQKLTKFVNFGNSRKFLPRIQ